MQTSVIGKAGEKLVEDELKKLGYKIIARNWKIKAAEIDIVALKGGVIYFVEVKYRKNENYGSGFDYITSKKLNHMKRAAELWVNLNNWRGEYLLLAASIDGSKKQAELIEIL